VQLYFSPLACSMAARICLYEAGASATFTEVDTKLRRTRDGQDYLAVHPLGLVPVLRTDAGEVLSENAAVLQYLAGQLPHARLAPDAPLERARLQQWLCFIGTELHKALFVPLLDKKAPEAVKAYALEKGTSRLDMLDAHLKGREFLLERFSVADPYLFTVLHWSQVTPVDLKRWPALLAYFERVGKRPSVARALAEEGALYLAELKRHRAA
jgi:glutathione S-transferase